jgi:hypothetical protein
MGLERTQQYTSAELAVEVDPEYGRVTAGGHSRMGAANP